MKPLNSDLVCKQKDKAPKHEDIQRLGLCYIYESNMHLIKQQIVTVHLRYVNSKNCENNTGNYL